MACRTFKEARRCSARAVPGVSVVICAALACAGGCNAGGGGPPADDGVVQVSIGNLAFTPKSVTIQQGQTVRWTNNESNGAIHTTTSGSPDDEAQAGQLWDSGELNPGDTFERTFSDVGEFTYFCDIHEELAAMRDARVIVQAP